MLRIAAGFTIEELADLCRTTTAHLSRLERGLGNPTVRTLTTVADAIGVELLDLLADPKGSLRSRLVEHTRRLPKRKLKQLERDMRRQAGPPLAILPKEARTDARRGPRRKKVR